MMRWLNDPSGFIAAARARGDEAFVRAVATVLDRADIVSKLGFRITADRLYLAVAELDDADKVVELGIQEARTVLERRGVKDPPSAGASYEAYLAALPPVERHLRIARQALAKLASQPGDAEATSTAIRHLEEVERLGSLSGRDKKILRGLQARRGA